MRDRENTPARERWEAENDHVLEKDDMERPRESSRHRSKDKDKSSRKEEREHTSRHRERSKTNDVLEGREEVKDYEKSKISSRDRRKDERDRDEHDRVRSRDKIREKESDRDKYKDEEHEREKSHRDKGKEKEREREREREADKDGEHARPKERGKEKSKDRDKEGDKGKDREKNKEREKHKDRERERERGKDVVDREKVKDWEKEREGDRDKDRHRGREKGSRKLREEDNDRSKNDGVDDMKTHEQTDVERDRSQRPSSELEERILMMKEERMKKKSEGVSEVLSWVSKSRKLEEKRNSEKEKVLQLSKVFEEQDNINEEESDDLAAAQHTAQDLAGVKVLHGLDKVIEGGAVVLTLKDQSILAGGDINEEIDMLENVEIGEQKRRNEAYNAAKKKTGIYEDKFNEEPGSERKMLPQYDDPVTDEGVTLDASGRFSAEAEKKLEELRRRIGGASANKDFLDLNSSGKISSDYMTQEEMLQFKKPKKKKSLRKKEKLDIDALEAEALSSGLGVEDLGSRKDRKRQALRQEQERTEAKMRSNAYQSAYAKADEASKALRLGKILNFQAEEDDTPAFGDDDDDLRKSLERARKLAIKKQDEKTTSGPQAIALLASSTANNSTEDNQHPVHGESQENKVVFTEMEEFVWGLQLDEEAEKHDGEDVFMEEDVAPTTYAEEMEEDNGGLAEIEDTAGGDSPKNENKEDIVPDEVIHEVAVGKGLSSALKLLKERGTLKERIEWGGRNMDKKKGKLVGIYENDGTKEIRIERTDEYGRILTPKEAFRQLSHKFHGKGPGKKKQEKRMREYHEELKIKQMKNADTPSLSVERMREAQSKLKTPYLVLSGNVKPGQTSDPRSGFATVEKDFPGGLTPMLGDRKVEHFLGIKRKSESGGDMGPPKIPKT